MQSEEVAIMKSFQDGYEMIFNSLKYVAVFVAVWFAWEIVRGIWEYYSLIRLTR